MIYFRKINIVGKRSKAIVIPADIARNKKWERGQKLVIEMGDDGIIKIYSELEYRKRQNEGKKQKGLAQKSLRKVRLCLRSLQKML